MNFGRSLLAFDAWFGRYLSCLGDLATFDAWSWRYLSCLRALGHFYCLPSMLAFDAICRSRTHFWMSLAASMPTTIGLTRSVTHEFWKIIACLRCLIKTDCTFEWRKENEPTSRHNSWVGLDFRFYFVGFEWVWMFYFLFLDCLILDSWFFVCLEFCFFGC